MQNKNPLSTENGFCIGWGIGIRTPTNRVRVCRATVTLFPNVTRIWATDIYYTQLNEKVNIFIDKFLKLFYNLVCRSFMLKYSVIQGENMVKFIDNASEKEKSPLWY